MKQKKLALFVFVDAFGWEILQRHPNFLQDIAPNQKKLRTVFGYSSACDPSFISGMLPSEHGHWSSYYYSPKTSPFSWTKNLHLLPSFIANRSRIRNRISRYISWREGFTGYFQIYNVPFKHLPLFDYAEKKWMWGTRHGLLRGKTIFDHLLDHHIPFYVKENHYISDERAWEQAEALIHKRWIAYAFLFLGKLDALMHAKGNQDLSVKPLIRSYEKKIRTLFKVAEGKYQEVSIYVFSDHGMHNVHSSFNLIKEIEALPLTYEKDYVAMYDSTMARFWFLNNKAKKTILNCLLTIDEGCILSETQLKDWGTFFPNHQYGECIFLMQPGTLIVPSYMGLKAIPGMHGYHPDNPDSAAMVVSNQPLSQNLIGIEHLFSTMLSEVGLEKNSPREKFL